MTDTFGIARFWLIIAFFNLTGAYFTLHAIGPPDTLLPYVVAALGLIVFASGFAAPRGRYVLRGTCWWMGAAMLMFGYGAGRMQVPTRQSQMSLPDSREFTVRITGFAESKKKVRQAEAEVWACKQADNFAALPKPVPVMLFFDTAHRIAPGDVWLVKGRAQRPQGPAFRDGFDYAGYLARKGIGHTLYVGANQGIRLDSGQIWAPLLWVWHIRTVTEQRLESLFAEHHARAIAKAITLGIRLRDEQLRGVFEQTGTIHILAVSGLHVGVVMWVFSLLAAPLGRLPGGKIGQVIFTLAGVWAFALVTGLPSSACRAALMFTFLSCSALLPRGRIGVAQALGLTFFVLTAYRPAYFFDLGFQLSAAAVAGLALITPLFDNSRLQRWPALPKYLALSAVASFAAQLAVLPLVLYYFGSFPLLFWLSNPVAVPAAFVLLTGSMGAVALSFVYLPAAHILATGVEWLTGALMAVLNALSGVPGAVLNNFFLSAAGALCSGLAIVWLVLFLHRPLPHTFQVFAGWLLLFTGLLAYRAYELKNQHTLTVFNTPGHTALVLAEGGRATVYTDMNSENWNFSIKPFLQRQRIDSTLAVEPLGERDVFCLPAKQLQVVCIRKKPALMPDTPLRTRVLVVGKDAFATREEAGKYFAADRIIFDASCSLPNADLPVSIEWKE